MIQEVQLLVSELRRITILWDELWLGTLNQHSSNISKVIAQLEHEVEKVEKNEMLSEDQKRNIIKEKHKTVLKPVSLMVRFHRAMPMSLLCPFCSDTNLQLSHCRNRNNESDRDVDDAITFALWKRSFKARSHTAIANCERVLDIEIGIAKMGTKVIFAIAIAISHCE